MHNERHVSLFRNGRNQAIRIPREFELEGTEAIIRKEDGRLIIEPVKQKNLRELLATLPALDEDFPEITDPFVEQEGHDRGRNKLINAVMGLRPHLISVK